MRFFALLLVLIVPSGLSAQPQLEAGEWRDREYLFQQAPDGAQDPAIMVWFHGMTRGDPIGAEKQFGYLDRLSQWALEHEMALLIPFAEEGPCEQRPRSERDWRCWPTFTARREIIRMEALIEDLEAEHGEFSAMQALGLSRGAYFLSVAWGRGAMDDWERVGLLSGAQSPERWRTSNTPPIAIEYGALDPGNARFVEEFVADLARRPLEDKVCVRETEAGHLPDADGFGAFLEFVAQCASDTPVAD